MEKKVKFQSIKVPYPKKIYSTALWLNKNRLILFPLYKAHKNLKNAVKYGKEAVREIRKMADKKDVVLDHLLILKCEYLHEHPLKKSMWDPPEIKFNDIDRNNLFIDAIDKPGLYDLVITSNISFARNTKVSFTYTSTFPILKSANDQMDILMRASDTFVSPESKNAGVYGITDVIVYDLTMKETLKDPEKYMN